MKTDFSFKLLSLVILAGVVIAIVNPGSGHKHPHRRHAAVTALR